jgi:hypothetical protein
VPGGDLCITVHVLGHIPAVDVARLLGFRGTPNPCTAMQICQDSRHVCLLLCVISQSLCCCTWSVLLCVPWQHSCCSCGTTLSTRLTNDWLMAVCLRFNWGHVSIRDQALCTPALQSTRRRRCVAQQRGRPVSTAVPELAPGADAVNGLPVQLQLLQWVAASAPEVHSGP